MSFCLLWKEGLIVVRIFHYEDILVSKEGVIRHVNSITITPYHEVYPLSRRSVIYNLVYQKHFAFKRESNVPKIVLSNIFQEYKERYVSGVPVTVP